MWEHPATNRRASVSRHRESPEWTVTASASHRVCLCLPEGVGKIFGRVVFSTISDECSAVFIENSLAFKGLSCSERLKVKSAYFLLTRMK
jgi:hypothetical protein